MHNIGGALTCWLNTCKKRYHVNLHVVLKRTQTQALKLALAHSPRKASKYLGQVQNRDLLHLFKTLIQLQVLSKFTFHPCKLTFKRTPSSSSELLWFCTGVVIISPRWWWTDRWLGGQWTLREIKHKERFILFTCIYYYNYGSCPLYSNI